jgi:hypothetical protein
MPLAPVTFSPRNCEFVAITRRKAEAVKSQIVSGQWATAHGSYDDLLDFVGSRSGNVVSGSDDR